MAESGNKLTIELMHQELNPVSRDWKRNEEKMQWKRMNFLKFKKEKEMSTWNSKQFKGTCRNGSKFGHKAVNFSKKESNEKTNDASTIKKYHFSGKCFYCCNMGLRISDCCKK